MNERPKDEGDERPSDPEFGRWLSAALGEAPRPNRSLVDAVEHRIFVHSRGRHFRRTRRLTHPSLLLLAIGCVVSILAAAAYVTLGPLWSTEASSPESPGAR